MAHLEEALSSVSKMHLKTLEKDSEALINDSRFTLTLKGIRSIDEM